MAEIYNHFSISAPRIEKIERIMKELRDPIKRLVRYPDTRWSYLIDVVKRTIDLMAALFIYFKETYHEAEYKKDLYKKR